MMKMYKARGLETILYSTHEKPKKSDKLDCHQCEHHNYDWFDDGDEFEVCEKGHEVHPDECYDFEEL